MEIKYLEVLEMPNDELICNGESLGFSKDLKDFLFTKEQLFKDLIPAQITITEADTECLKSAIRSLIEEGYNKQHIQPKINLYLRMCRSLNKEPYKFNTYWKEVKK